MLAFLDDLRGSQQCTQTESCFLKMHLTHALRLIICRTKLYQLTHARCFLHQSTLHVLTTGHMKISCLSNCWCVTLQDNGLVPIVEPEMTLGAGEYTIEDTSYWSERVLTHVFRHLNEQDVMLEGILMKPSMCLPGMALPAM